MINMIITRKKFDKVMEIQGFHFEGMIEMGMREWEVRSKKNINQKVEGRKLINEGEKNGFFRLNNKISSNLDL